MLNDIINKYQETYKIIETTPNPKVQLAAITEFFRFCERKKLSHFFYNFIPDFLNFFINIFKNSSVDFIDPQYIVISRYLIKESLSIEKDEIVLNEIRTVLESVNLRLLILYYYTGEVENGKVILQDLLNSEFIRDSGVSLERYSLNKSVKHKSSFLVDPGLFKVSKVFDILRQLNYELGRINSFSSDEINILLVESENKKYIQDNFGIVQSLECKISKKKDFNKENPVIENIIDVQNCNFKDTAINLINTASIIVSYFGVKKISSDSQIFLRFHDLSGIYKGTSFGIGASVLIAAKYLKSINSRITFTVSNAAAFSGSVDASGKLLPLPEESVKTKVKAAFFSWIKYVVLPNENLRTAENELNILLSKYPEKNLILTGINHVNELINNKDIIKIQKDSLTVHSKRLFNKHRISAFTFLAILFAFFITFAAWNLIPRKLKPLPELKGNLNMIYTPDRDTAWTYKSMDRVHGDTFFVGEIGIGDMITHKFNLINNDDIQHPLRMEIHGRDKDEFDVVWLWETSNLDPLNYINPESKQRNIIKFIPFKSPGDKEAELVFFNNDKPEKKRIIYLRGKAADYKGGYSMRLADDDEYVINPKRGNLLGKEFAFSLWFKTNLPGIHLFSSNNSVNTLTKFSVSIYIDTTLQFTILNPKSLQTSSITLQTKKHINLNLWNYIAVTNKGNKTVLIVNDELITYKTDKNHFQQIEDCFIFGNNVFFNESEYKSYMNNNWELFIAELRFYNAFIPIEELINKKHEKENYLYDNILLYHDYEEMVGHFIFDKSNNDIFGELFRLPYKSLDFPPLKIHYENKNFSNPCVRIKNKGEIRLNKNIFRNNSSFTVILDAKAEGNLKKALRKFFSTSNYDYSLDWYYCNGDSVNISYANIPLKEQKELASIERNLDSKWHRYIFDYDYEKNRGRFFIDGELLAEYYLGEYKYNIAREFYFMLFGKEGIYDNQRLIGEETHIDNIVLLDRTLSYEELSIQSNDSLLKLPGLLALWDFSDIKNQAAYDKLNKLPLFIYNDFDIIQNM